MEETKQAKLKKDWEAIQALDEAERKERYRVINQLAEASRLRTKPKGFLMKRCPDCGSRLKTKTYFASYGVTLDASWTHYWCPKCPYEYAI